MRPLWAAVIWIVAAGSGAGCRQPNNPDARQTGAFHGSLVLESSGAAMSRAHPGLFWTLNDSGNPASLFLADTAGTIRGVVSVATANRDWEALSAGPCGAEWCLYVADIGDNGAARASVVILRVREPGPEALDAATAPIVDSLVVAYEDGPRDAETLIVDSLANAAIVTKGQGGGSSAYLIPADAWGGPPLTLTPSWSLPISTGLLLGRMITDGALSPSGRVLAVRTYRTVHLFVRQPGDDWLPTDPAGTCDLRGLEPLGEGLAWWDDETLLLTSEALAGRAGPITLLSCPLP